MRGKIRDPGLAMPACWYWIRRMQAGYLGGNREAAVAAACKAEALRWTAPTFIVMADYHFYAGLLYVAELEGAPVAERDAVAAAAQSHRTVLSVWAQTCPDTFGSRAALVDAELARVEGRVLEAMELYERAARLAREYGFVQNEALANEHAARFYLKRGFERIAHAHARDARRCYGLWGADGKVRQLEREYPRVPWEAGLAGPTGAIAAHAEHLDLGTVIKVSQTIAAEVVPERLLEIVMRTAIEHAGAERAALVLSSGAEQRVAAEAVTQGDGVVVRLTDEPVSSSLLPEAIVRYVLQAQESVILDDAMLERMFATDPYVRRRKTRSVLCLPITNRGAMVGALYLENDLAPCVFVPARIVVLKLLASQAATSLENARLYRDLAVREAKIRRLVDANVIGIFLFEEDGRILEANDAFLTIVGYGREDATTGRLDWTRMTPPEWLEHDERRYLPALKKHGILQPFEKEYFRKDGSRVPVLVGAASFEGTTQGVAYVLDLSERKRVQEALHRTSDELARMSRITAVSALTASVAHEVSQPLSALLANASASLRTLEAGSPNIAAVQDAVRSILRDGKRAADVVHRMRALFSNRDFTIEQVDLNELIREVIGLATSELQKNQVVAHAELWEGLPGIAGDRVQLLQVILNLVRNASDAMADVTARPREIWIHTALERDDIVTLSVRDVGIGLPSEDPDAVFKALFTTKKNGMGIGLFVSRSIVERHKGQLQAHANDGPGATFVLSLPRFHDAH